MSIPAKLAPLTKLGSVSLLGAARLLARSALRREEQVPRVSVKLTVLTPRGRAAVEVATELPTRAASG